MLNTVSNLKGKSKNNTKHRSEMSGALLVKIHQLTVCRLNRLMLDTSYFWKISLDFIVNYLEIN